MVTLCELLTAKLAFPIHLVCAKRRMVTTLNIPPFACVSCVLTLVLRPALRNWLHRSLTIRPRCPITRRYENRCCSDGSAAAFCPRAWPGLIGNQLAAAYVPEWL